MKVSSSANILVEPAQRQSVLLRYTALQNYGIRIAALPLNVFETLTSSSSSCLSSSSPSSSPSSSNSGTKNGAYNLRAAEDELAQQMLDFFTDVTNNKALEIASHSLHQAFEKARAKSERLDSSVVLKLLMYSLRMSTRPTPFGAFSSVGLGRWSHRFDFEALNAVHRLHARLDMHWLQNFVRSLEQKQSILDGLNVMVHPCAIRRRDRIYLNYPSPAGQTGENQSSRSIRCNKLVEEVWKNAQTPISFKLLSECLLKLAGHEKQFQVQKFLKQLLNQDFLITSLRPNPIDMSPAKTLLSALQLLDVAADELRQYVNLLREISDYEVSSTSSARSAPQRTMQRSFDIAEKLCDTKRSHFLQVDSTVELPSSALSQAVADDIALLSQLMIETTVWPSGAPHLDDYKSQFSERYCEGQHVPLLELLDPHFGLGDPYKKDGGRNSSATGIFIERERHLAYLHSIAMRNNSLEIELTKDDLKKLKTFSANTKYPDAVEIFVNLSATSKGAIERGDYRVSVGPYGLAYGAKRSIGRFAPYFDIEKITDSSTGLDENFDYTPSLSGNDQRATTGGIRCAAASGGKLVQLVHLPRKAEAANVVISPCINSTTVDINTFSSSACVNAVSNENPVVIPLREILVAYLDGAFRLIWSRTGELIEVEANHLLNFTVESPIGRFLLDVSRDGFAYPLPFQWGALSSFPFLPRIRYERCILFPATWKFEKANFTQYWKKEQHDRFAAAIQSLREQWQIPRFVFVGGTDNRLMLDLSDAMHLEVLRKELRGPEPFITFVEASTINEFGWTSSSEQKFCVELAVSLLQKESLDVGKRRSSNANKSIDLNDVSIASALVEDKLRTKAPGSDWLYLKLYVVEDLEEDVISKDIAAFAKGLEDEKLVDYWFFVRYEDPKRHVRLRFHGEPEKLAEVFPRLCEFAHNLVHRGSCLTFAFDTYQREIERYGGIDIMECVEKIFCVDSVFGAELISFFQEKRSLDEKIPFAIIEADRFFKDLNFDNEDRAKYYLNAKAHKDLCSSEFRANRSLVTNLFSGNFDVPAKILATSEKRRECFDKIQASSLSLPERHELMRSVAHMHFNRLFGTNRLIENKILGLLYRAALSARYR